MMKLNEINSFRFMRSDPERLSFIQTLKLMNAVANRKSHVDETFVSHVKSLELTILNRNSQLCHDVFSCELGFTVIEMIKPIVPVSIFDRYSNRYGLNK